MLSTELRILIRDTGRVWWRLLPMIIGVYLFGWLGSHALTVLGALNDLATQHLGWLLAIIVGIYVLRRLLDYVAERTGWRILGFLVVLIEAFFMLLVIMGGIRVFQIFRIWLLDRAVIQWLAEIQRALARFIAMFKIDLQEILTWTWAFFSDQVWPVLVDVVAQPLFWLAMAALVFGSKVLSLAELWRQGQPYAALIPGATAFAIARSRLSAARSTAQGRSVSCDPIPGGFPRRHRRQVLAGIALAASDLASSTDLPSLHRHDLRG